MERILYRYKGHELYAHPHQVDSTLEWTTQVHILKGELCSPYWASNTWPTELEAVARSLRFGQLIIDGDITPSIP